MTARYSQRAAVVTGAASGIGLAIAKRFLQDGLGVALIDLQPDAARKAAKQIDPSGKNTIAMGADVSNTAQVKRAMDAARKRFKTLDVLVNSAGFQYVSPIVDLDERIWTKLIAVHLTGTFLCTQAVLSGMIDRRRGRIINISSIHGKVASKFKAPYVSAKHGVLGFTKVLALEVAEHNITANAICPGYVHTPLVENQLPSLAKEHGMSVKDVLEKVVLKDVPQKRLLEPEEVASLAAYLASNEAQGITGQAINISGGWCMS